jgi:hypothetical protein
MHKTALAAIIVAIFTLSAFSQTATPPAAKKADPVTKIDSEKKVEKADKGSKDPFAPYTMATDDLLEVSWPTFSKKVDPKGRGDILEVMFSIRNNTDNKHQFYAFVLASYEEIKWGKNSFDTKKTFSEGIKIDYFAPYPDNKENFEYDINGEKQYKKFPKDYKLGVDSDTGKPYQLGESPINFRTEHLSVYRKNFKLFNNVTIIVYDDEGKMLFRQTYELKGKRTR